MKSLRFLIFVFSILLTAMAWAQTGTITGTVTDEDGQPIAGATVQAQGTQLKATTNNAGEYTIADVPASTYTLEASTYSYRKQTAQVTVASGQTATQNFALRIDLLALEEMVVTGTETPEKKIESSSAISTLSADEIAEAAPRSTSEYLRRIPGFTRVESSGGEVNQNINVRGITGVETVYFQEDGIAPYPTPHVFFMNLDNLIRIDENIQTIEVVRGGNAPVFGGSGAAAVVNLINKTGGDELHGVVKGTAGQDGLARFDFNSNGPLTDQWRFNVGGFYRYDHGSRDPGYPGTRGGMFKANVTRLMDNGFVKFSAKYIDDRNLFLLPSPHQNLADPTFVPGFSETGSYTTPEGVDLSVPLPRGNDLTFPLDNGIHTKGGWLTGEFNINLGNDWNFEDIVQKMSVDHQWNALPAGGPVFANEYAQGILNGLITNGTVPAGSAFQLLFTNHFDGKGNKLPYDTPNGLLEAGNEFRVDKPISSFANQFTIRKLFGNHQIAFGNYFAYYTQGNQWRFANVLTDIRDNPRFVDLVILRPDGTTFDVTKNGFRNFLGTYKNANGNNTLVAIFGSDEVKLSDLLRLDVGFRYEHQNYFQTAENVSTFDLDGNPQTTYNNEQFGNNTFRHFEFNIADVAYSAGLNYQLQPDHLAVYGSYTHGFWMPALDEFIDITTQQSIDLFEPRKTNTVEGGVKYSGPLAGFTATVFYTKLANVISRGVETDANGNAIFVSRPQPDTSGWGLEFEVLTRPTKVVELRSAATLVDINAPAGANTSSRFNGLTPALVDFEASYLFMPNARLSLDWHFVGTRFGNVERTVVFNKYNYINLGGSYKWPQSGVSAALRVLNLTQSQGIEEGDPRNDPSRGGASNLFNDRPILPRRVMAEFGYDW
jgi:iron complex outermembrane receptor protein